MHFHRPALARELARMLLSPAPLEQQAGAGLVLAGPPRTGKSCFLVSDLVPELSRRGALGVYVDVGLADREAPADLIRKALWAKSPRLLADSGTAAPATLLDTAASLRGEIGTDVVLIVDGVEGAPARRGGPSLLQGLCEALGAANRSAASSGQLRLLACGRLEANTRAMLADSAHHFTAAQVRELPVLDEAFVEFLLEVISSTQGHAHPKHAVAVEAFARLGHRPEELLRALTLLRALPTGHDPDTALLATANALRIAIYEREFSRLADLGALPSAVFARMTKGANAPFSDEAKSAYQVELGWRPSTSEIQTALNALVNASYVVRVGRGAYTCAHPMASKLWQEQQLLNFASKGHGT